MSYQGMPDSNLPSHYYETYVFPFLKKALIASTPSRPFRGPERFKEEDSNFQYFFAINGDYQYFTGHETIEDNEREVFFQDVMGSLIK